MLTSTRRLGSTMSLLPSSLASTRLSGKSSGARMPCSDANPPMKAYCTVSARAFMPPSGLVLHILGGNLSDG